MAKAVTDDFEDLNDLDEEEEVTAKKSSKSAGKSKAAAKKEKPSGLSATQVAEKLGADPKTFRAWLRVRVEKGEIELPERQGRERYVLGANWKDETILLIQKLWAETDHRKGGKKADDDGKSAPKKGKATAKRKPASKKKS